MCGVVMGVIMKKFLKEALEWLKSFAMAIIIFVILTAFGDVTQVYGQSMEPTLHQNDQLVYSKLSGVERGDIVIVRSEIKLTDSELSKMNMVQKWKIGDYKPLIKRIIAKAGDEVLIENGQVFINGVDLTEAYIGGVRTPGDVHIESIPTGYFFVMGDNRLNSLDSRSKQVGLVSEEQIEGKVLVRIFPFDDAGLL